MFSLFGAIFRFIGRFGPLVLLAAILFLTGVVLSLLGWLFGFSLDDVDAWLADHSSWLTAVADILFRLGCFFALVICAVVVVGAIVGLVRPAERRDLVRPPAGTEAEKPPGIGCALVALIVGYFAFVGTFMSY